MKPLLLASSSANPLTTATGASSLTAQSNAQKLRTHAQHKRGGVASFMYQFTERRLEAKTSRDIGPATADRPDRSRDQGADKLDAGSNEAESSENGPDSAAATRVSTAQSNAQGAQDAAAAPGEPEGPSFEQEFVSVILGGVDPMLRQRPAAEARAARTIAGNTREVKAAIEVDPAVQSRAMLPAAESEQSATRASNELPAETDHEASNENARQVQSKSHQPQDGRQSESKPPAAVHVPQGDRARADAAAAAAANAVPTPNRAVEQRVSLVPTLVAVSMGSPGRTAGSPGAAPARESSVPTPVAEQVEHGVQVAMRDLPSPGGERLVTLRLYPSALGSMRIAMHVSGETVNVRFQVGSAKAKAAVGKAIDDLRASITRQGLRVESLLIEEDSALAAPDEPGSDKTPLPDGLAAGSAAGKGIAIPLSAPPGPDGPRADDGTGRTPSVPGVDSEGGVLQVLTFRLDAVG